MIPIKKRIEVIVSGEVQAVGYREFVRKATFRRMITGFVQNLKDGKVKIVAEGSEEELKNFCNYSGFGNSLKILESSSIELFT